ncbi:MAG: hypothetical protein L7V86_26110, partial [Verrucomicrobiales bacterium]|nr:hypothetical protein [Verrucomicrobiales bacterium]
LRLGGSQRRPEEESRLTMAPAQTVATSSNSNGSGWTAYVSSPTSILDQALVEPSSYGDGALSNHESDAFFHLDG